MAAPGSRPNQPMSLNFPSRTFGKTTRSFQKHWFESFVWLGYDESKDVVFCHTCRTAEYQNKLHTPSKEPSFIRTGFSNWKDAMARFRNHEKSICHRVAMESVHPQAMDVAEMLSTEHNQFDYLIDYNALSKTNLLL